MIEPQKEYYYEKKHCGKKSCKCLALITSILFSLFLGTIGLILGAIFSIALIINLPVLIATTVILGLLTILVIVYKICDCRKMKK